MLLRDVAGTSNSVYCSELRCNQRAVSREAAWQPRRHRPTMRSSGASIPPFSRLARVCQNRRSTARRSVLSW